MNWKKELKNSICTIDQLKDYVDLSRREERELKRIIQRHPMRITPYYMSLIDWDNPQDPIKKMAVPSSEEFNLEGSYDTSGEAENTKLMGLQHKYEQTALVLATNRCALYCRHCFRKRLVGLPNEEIIKRFEDASEYIRQHTEINNVLISGGDPLVLSNEVVESFLSALSDISHLKFIRFGSRLPVTLPSRFDDRGLLDVLKEYSQRERRIYVVTQFNYPREITKKAIKAVDNLIQSGVIVNNQTVLLKGVNDYPRTLAKLQNKLISIGVNPYYVFQFRPVKRFKHSFHVPLVKGIWMVEEAKKRCNGHSKRFKYVMSHRTGKIEILGLMGNEMCFKYHQAKDRKNMGRMFKRKVDDTTSWLEGL